MKPTPIIAAIGTGAVLIMGGVDATKLEETPIQRVETVAGYTVEAKQIENRVETTFPWKDQPGLKVVVDLGEPTVAEKLSDKRKKEVVTEVVNAGDGGFKVDILLNEKPDTNRFCQTIEGAENYDFFHQPPLTEQEIADGVERPENVVGSYAVYHKALKNHVQGRTNYETGKVMHIYRPQVWSLADEEEKLWAELSYDEGQLCVTAPQEFLDKAEYPVRIDPTFGYTTAGASQTFIARFQSGLATDHIRGNRATSTSVTTVTSINIYINSMTATSSLALRAGIYTGINPDPFNIITNGKGATTTINSIGWKSLTFDVNPTISAQPYFLIAKGDGNAYTVSGQSANIALDTVPAILGLGAVGTAASGDSSCPLGVCIRDQISQGGGSGDWENITTLLDTTRYSIYAVTADTSGSLTRSENFIHPGTLVNATSTWTAPPTVTEAIVACWGGGGGGGDGSTNGGDGGGGGAFASSTVSVTPGTTYPIVIGGPGVGASSASSVDGTNGGTSRFDTTVVVASGGLGNRTGGATASSTGTTLFPGGTGGAPNTTGDTGGGGGGGAGPNGAGGNGANGVSSGTGGGGGGGNGGSDGSAGNGGSSTFGGTGGQGGNVSVGSTTPFNGLGSGGGGGGDDTFAGGQAGAVGGGGGGGENGGGNGGAGRCLITYTINSTSTVVLNSPADASSDSDTTPTLDFTGTDPEANDIRYNVQIATGTPIGNGAVIDTYNESNQDTQVVLGTGNQKVGQSFTGNGETLGSVQFYLNETTATGDIKVSIFAHSGTFGTNSVGTGAALATSDAVESSSIGASFTLVTFNFSGANQITLTNGTKYVVVVEDFAMTNTLNVGVDSTSPTHGGNSIFADGTPTWDFDAGFDVIFYVNTLDNVLLDKLSGTDSGFANPDVGGDTDPFTSGDNIQYTVQGGDALAAGTYYWRVRGIDPTGSNTYGNWSSTRSFTITAGGGGATSTVQESEWWF